MFEIDSIPTQLQEKWVIMQWALVVSLLSLIIAWQQGLFRSFQASSYPQIRGKEVLKGFAFFIFAELLLVPAFVSVMLILTGHEVKDILHFGPEQKGWLNVAIILGGFGGVFIAYLDLPCKQRSQLWRQTATPWFLHLGLGMISWFVIYPLVLAFNQAMAITTWLLFHHSSVEQVVVQHLRLILSQPPLFIVTGLLIITLVPLTEEFLFRGLLQSWLKQKLHHTSAAIAVSSLIFALFHYANAQGIANLELLSSLFLLSCMLGFLYERQRSLWAPLGLHGFFNLISLMMIFKES